MNTDVAPTDKPSASGQNVTYMCEKCKEYPNLPVVPNLPPHTTLLLFFNMNVNSWGVRLLLRPVWSLSELHDWAAQVENNHIVGTWRENRGGKEKE